MRAFSERVHFKFHKPKWVKVDSLATGALKAFVYPPTDRNSKCMSTHPGRI